jgi:hypothetical protein
MGDAASVTNNGSINYVYLSIKLGDVIVVGESRGLFHQHVYSKLLHPKIPKAQKDSQVTTVFFVLLGSAHVKHAHKMLMKYTPKANAIFL